MDGPLPNETRTRVYGIIMCTRSSHRFAGETLTLKRLLPLVMLGLLALPCLGAPSGAKLTPRLARVLADEGSVVRRDDGTLTIWVHFTGRDLSTIERAAALAAADASLPERTRRRRGKMLAPGATVVDARDLPLTPSHLAGVADTGARIRRHSRWLNAVSAEATDAQIGAIAALPQVERIDLVARYRRNEPIVGAADLDAARAAREAARADVATWHLNYGGSLAGLAQINVPQVHEMGYTGQGVVIGVLDSGFKTTHEALESVTVLARYDFVDDDPVVEEEPGDAAGQHNHGTKVLSAVAGYRDNELVGAAFGAGVILAKTEDRAAEYPVEEDYWVAGLEWVELMGADIVTSSLGYTDWYEFSDLDGNTAVTTIAADLAVGRGLVVVNSAGNERGTGTDHILAPADGDSVIAVGAVDVAGNLAAFSSPGPSFDGRIKPDVAAQGVGNHVVALIDDESYTSSSGTSFACPLVSGVAALVLSRAPTLTPLQVREALRETADQAHAPDNDFGWGVVDALAAVTYWGASIDHDPLPDTENTGDPYTVIASVTDRLPLDPRRMHLFWRADTGVWLAEPLELVNGNRWQATIPAQPAGTEVTYFLEVTDTSEVTTSLPILGPDAPFSFAVGPDITPPVIVHTPLGNQPITAWPPVITATVTDNLGVDGVSLTYMVNAGPVQGPYPLSAAGPAYAVAFPLEPADVAVGDRIAYTLTAWDLAGEPNGAQSGPSTFEVMETLGLVLVLDDSGGSETDLKFDPDKGIVPSRVGGSAAAEVAGWLGAAGFTAPVMPLAAATPDSLEGYDLVVVSTGDNTAPVATAGSRALLRNWVLAGGRLLIEGGEIAYDALSSPGYPDFARDVLHATSWRGDNAGSIRRMSGLENHPLLVRPYVLPATIPVIYQGYGDQDAVNPAAGAVTIMDSSGQPGAAGILLYDDNAAPESGQIVYFAFHLGAVHPATGRALVENAVTFLMAPEPPPTAGVSGAVFMADRSDPAGVSVALDGAFVTVTGAGGQFQIDGLYGGDYMVVASRDGYATVRRAIELDDGEMLGGVNIELRPAVVVQAAAAPHVPIPDDDVQGVTSVITVGESGILSDLTVDIDIRHTWIGDLTVYLTSPLGTQITLHDQSGGPADDITGNWPATLTVDGPGTLDDFVGEDLAGQWTLFIRDTSPDGTRILRIWGLDARIPAPPTAADGPPMVTRLLGAHPNPFNPRTEVVLDLARRGPVRLEVFDLRGRLVRSLVAGDLPAGRHRVDWDGRDGAGRETASGVYLCRLAAAGDVHLRKLTLVR